MIINSRTTYAKRKTISKKIQLIALCTAIGFLIAGARLFYLQINLSTYFSQQSTKNFLRTEKTYSPRGNIRDCNGLLLATNRPVTSLYWQGTGNRKISDTQQCILQQLEDILAKSLISDQETLHHIMQAERLYKKIPLARDISFEQLSKIEEQLSNQTNLTITTHFKRYYPYKSYACHILGYLGFSMNIVPYGKMGLEKLFEDLLKGEDGAISKTINSVGKNLAETKIKESLAGTDIQLTLNIWLQRICERVFPKSAAGTLILLNPANGALISVVSRPSFDPDIFLHPISYQEWQTLQEKKPFLNRAFNANYPPGSIFKLVTVCAALEHGYISTDSTINCKGFTYFGKRKYWCNRHYGHGEITLEQSLAKSCNPLFFEIGKKIDIDLLADYAYRFGLGKKTNIIFPEQQGLVPTHKWKKEVKGEPWWPGETLSVSIGQSFLLTTPIQIAVMISSILTGYKVKPRILSTEPIEKQPLMIKPEVCKFLKKSMKQVVTKGTGRHISQVKDIKVYAKTSTAQTSSISKRHLGSQYLEHGWFVAYFKYKNNEPLTLVVLVEHAGSSQVATTIAKNFLFGYKAYFDKKTHRL